MDEDHSITLEAGVSSKRLNVALHYDLLSSLPDHLLLHILSFLDMKDAVLTGILSRRWRDLWTSIRDLTFDKDCHEATDDPETNFINFVDRSLILHLHPVINKFCLRLVFDRTKYNSRLDAWIRFAVARRVQELDLDLYTHDSHQYKLPSWLFKCDTLTSLKLKLCRTEVPDFVHFSILSSLSLWYVDFDNASFRKLLDGCPLLEELVLDDCIIKPHLAISSSHSKPFPLKSLTIKGFTTRFGFEVEAPNLHMLKINGTIYGDSKYFLDDMVSLKGAYLVLHMKMFSNKCSFNSIMESFLSKLCYASVLKLNTLCIQAMRHVQSYFLNAKCLTLQTSLLKSEEEGMVKLLEASPHLETLIIELSRVAKLPNGSKRCGLGRSDISCMLCLKTIKITGFIGGKYVSKKQDSKIRLASFLLQNAEVLEKMVIDMSTRPYSVREKEWDKIKSVVAEKLIAVPRASAYAQVLFL